jgi:hypothetical protein
VDRRVSAIVRALDGAGGTVDLITCQRVTRGYSVGGNGASITLRRADVDLATYRAVADLVARGEDYRALAGPAMITADAPRYGIGAWVDDDGAYCLDLVDIMTSESRARTLAILRRETAFGDLAAYAAGLDGTRYVS